MAALRDSNSGAVYIVSDRDVPVLEVDAGVLRARGTHTLGATLNGVVILSELPTDDPAVAGQLWSNSGVLTVSAG